MSDQVVATSAKEADHTSASLRGNICSRRSSSCLSSGGAGCVLMNSSSIRRRSAKSPSTSSLLPGRRRSRRTLVEGPRREIRLEGLGHPAIRKVTDDDRQGYTAPDQVEAPVPSFNEFLSHLELAFSLSRAENSNTLLTSMIITAFPGHQPPLRGPASDAL